MCAPVFNQQAPAHTMTNPVPTAITPCPHPSHTLPGQLSSLTQCGRRPRTLDIPDSPLFTSCPLSSSLARRMAWCGRAQRCLSHRISCSHPLHIAFTACSQLVHSLSTPDAPGMQDLGNTLFTPWPHSVTHAAISTNSTFAPDPRPIHPSHRFHPHSALRRPRRARAPRSAMSARPLALRECRFPDRARGRARPPPSARRCSYALGSRKALLYSE